VKAGYIYYDDAMIPWRWTMDEDTWTNILVSQIDDSGMPQWAKDLIASGYPKTLVKTAYVKYDREQSALEAYA
jgi:hypothetical protein